MKRLHFLLAFSLLLTSCMVGPRYHKPVVCMPLQFEEAQEGEYIQDEDLCEWWKQFEDPVLDELITEALCANYDYLIALERINQARSEYRIEKSYLWPEIDANASATRTRISRDLLPNFDNRLIPSLLSIFQVGFDAIWELDIFGKYRHGKNAACYVTQAVMDDAQGVMISLVSEVAVNYVAIRTLQDRIEITKRIIEADERELQIIADLYELGLNNETKITSKISAIESQRATLPVLENSLKQAIFTVAYLLGKPPECFVHRFDEYYPIPSGKNRVPIGLPSDLLRRRPDIRSAERQLAAATEQIGAAVADLFPHVALTGVSFGGGGDRMGSSVGYTSRRIDHLITDASRTFSFGLAIDWAMIDFGRVRANIDVRTSLQLQAFFTYEQTVMASLKDVESALAAYFEEDKRRSSLEKKRAADLRTLEITEDLHSIGLATEVEILEAEKNLLESENLFIESEQALTGDLIAVYKALGGCWSCCY